MNQINLLQLIFLCILKAESQRDVIGLDHHKHQATLRLVPTSIHRQNYPIMEILNTKALPVLLMLLKTSKVVILAQISAYVNSIDLIIKFTL